MDEVRKTFGMIVVHMREKYRIELLWPYAKLRQPHCGAAACIEL